MAVGWISGVAQKVVIPCYDGATPTAPTTPVATVSTDGGAFGAADNSPSVVGTTAVLTLSASEMTGAVVAVNIASDNLEDHVQVYYVGGEWTAARAASLDTIATDVLDGSLAGYEATAESATTLGGMVAIMRSVIAGKMTIAADVLTVYEVDGSTALATFALSPANGPYTSRGAPS